MASRPIPNTDRDTSITRIRKTVTPLKIAANQKNAKNSTGPKTERGKRASRFNAVTLGLFAKHVAIPYVDGDNVERKFRAFLDEIHREFLPSGVYEEWLVVRIGECMWRLRRATRCERGAIGVASGSVSVMDHNFKLFAQLHAHREAEAQLRSAGKLSPALYEKFLPVIETIQQKRSQDREDSKLRDVGCNRQELLAHISGERASLEQNIEANRRLSSMYEDDHADYDALLPAEDMERILRYEEKMLRQIDWAVQRLMEAQERRRTIEIPTASTAMQ